MDEAAKLRRFLAPAECQVGGTVTLAPEQSRHMVTVLRLGRGRAVRLFTGAGREFLGRIEEADAAGARVRILEELAPTARALPALTLAFAPAPGNRSDIVIEKATELGAARFVPLLCERLQGGRAEAAARRADRWRRKAEDAARQSQRTVVPVISAPAPFERFVEAAEPGARIIAAGPGYPGLFSVLDGAEPAPGPISLAVGPAGGFTQRELGLACDAGFLPVSLGPHVLRVETAAICLLAGVVLYLDGDL
jgi:16S rRNA (uracil1498-N3)-methyltransferase